MFRLLSILILSLFTGACVTIDSKPFKDGAEVPTPPGCVEGRTRNVDC